MSVEKVIINLFGTGWYNAMRAYLQSQEFVKLGHWLMAERKQKRIYPEQKNVFKAFQLTPYEKVNVVFLGISPYIKKHQATGLSFGIEISENMMITPQDGQLNSHLDMWKEFTLNVIDAINRMHENVIFILIGEEAQLYEQYLNPLSTRLIKVPYPTKEIRGKSEFYDNNIFSKCNAMLYMLEKEEINWDIK